MANLCAFVDKHFPSFSFPPLFSLSLFVSCYHTKTAFGCFEFFFSFVHCFIMQSCSHHIKKTCFVHNPSLSLSMHNISAQLWWKYQSSSTFKWWCQMLESFVRFKLYCISWFSFYNLYIRSLQFSPYGRRESMEYAAAPVILQWLTTRLVKFNVFQTIIPYFKVNDQTFTKLIFHSKKYHLLNEKNNY